MIIQYHLRNLRAFSDQPEDNVRPGERELWRHGDRGRVDVVRQVEQVVVVLDGGSALLQPDYR